MKNCVHEDGIGCGVRATKVEGPEVRDIDDEINDGCDVYRGKAFVVALAYFQVQSASCHATPVRTFPSHKHRSRAFRS